ncbi:hypothetical protein [Shimwellia blattae]|uniref:Uncharacterized protein n=1 Tax=Shimwellia blattae (strain ATCC 29907 / DSM 4481 / JCM 1650 / NBRC 105725 / CDC 9005-74) TaxID=630626 RepID=I2BBJ2_SHIBC|nr:hypothetical protein [Shimwellia blattae]AFJ47896.1 hypothetical protein EBL_c28260 [Shimwellia blattae DSM 4481 = NBRC 105725]GAB79534.1 hypothetical protein EB105725_01_00490 [Shimwellia blattae DSM 4481 = NBRC 105725]VDY65396.1 Uncharacterised protein [Shimwellia blattae]VEC24475.1 Uncharacterised protein [Shimwellia blattae]
MSPYLHQTQNRIRVRSDFILRNPGMVARQVATMEGMPGVLEVVHRRYAGSVAVRFDEHKISSKALLAHIEAEGWLSAQKDKAYIDTTVRHLTRHVAKGLAVMTFNMVVKPSMLKTVVQLIR